MEINSSGAVNIEHGKTFYMEETINKFPQVLKTTPSIIDMKAATSNTKSNNRTTAKGLKIDQISLIYICSTSRIGGTER